jgi:hypothetical protein
MPETEISDHKFPFCPSHALHRKCDAMTLLHAQPTHSPEFPRFVGRDVNDVTSGGRYGLDVYNPKIVIYYDFHVNLSSNNLCLLKEENTPIHAIAMNTNSFPRDSQFPWFRAVVSGIP